MICGVPHHRELIEAMLAFNLIGFQTEDDCENFAGYLRSDLGLEVKDGVVTSRYGTSRLAAFPIGIDVEGFAAQAARAVSHPDVSRLRKSLHGERLAIGVDRVDYSKGLVNRIRAFDRLYELEPSLKRAVSLLQIATPSRGNIEAYGNLQDKLAKLVTDVNGRHGEVDWTPDPVFEQGFQPDHSVGILSFGRSRRGDANARRHEIWSPRNMSPRRIRSIPACWCCRNSPGQPTN